MVSKSNKLSGGDYRWNNRNRKYQSEYKSNSRKNKYTKDEIRYSKLNSLKLSKEEPNSESNEEKLLGCTNKSWLNCRGNCKYKGFPLLGNCVPKVLLPEYDCHKKAPLGCSYPCRTVNYSGSKTRPNCVHYPIKNAKEITSYVKQIHRTKNQLVEYFSMLKSKRDEIKKWIEDGRHKLLKEETSMKAKIENLKRDQGKLKNLEEQALLGKKIVEKEQELKEISKDVSDMEELLREVIRVYATEKAELEDVKKKMEQEEKLIKTDYRKSEQYKSSKYSSRGGKRNIKKSNKKKSNMKSNMKSNLKYNLKSNIKSNKKFRRNNKSK